MKKEDINTIDDENKLAGSEDTVENVSDTVSEDKVADDAQVDDTSASAEASNVETVEDALEKAKAEIEELKRQALYKQAEFENFRKRTVKEKADLVLSGGEKTITAILPVLDDFERALQDKSEDAEAVREGMRLIFAKFVKTLGQLGVKKIETDGVDFDVDFHESIALVPGMGDDKKGKVIDCVQTGYTLNDKVIRYAKVAVGQ